MSTMFVHDLVIERVAHTGSDDEYGQPAASSASQVAVRGLVQPRTAREIDDSRSAGGALADHIIFLPNGTGVDTTDSVVFGESRYEIVGIRPFEYGGLAHVEVDARRIGTVEVGS